MTKYIFKKKRFALLAYAADAFGYLFLKRSKPFSDPQTILLIRLDHIGDVLLATPVPHLLKQKYPSVKIIFLTNRLGSALIEQNPFVDEIILYDAPWFSKGRTSKNEGLSWKELKKILTDRKIDWGITLRGDAREIWLMKQVRIPIRAGYGITGLGFFLTHEAIYRKGVHEAQHNLDVLALLGATPAKTVSPEIYLSVAEAAALDSKWHTLGLEVGRSYVGFQVESGMKSKNWPVKHIQLFIDEFYRRFPDKTLLLIGANHRLELTQNSDSLKLKDLRGKTTLRELCYLIKKCELFIGPDSGPTHLASVLGIPTIFLYSGTNDFQQWRPLNSRAVTIKASVVCAACEAFLHDQEGHACMAGIEPDRVLKAVEDCFKGTPSK